MPQYNPAYVRRARYDAQGMLDAINRAQGSFLGYPLGEPTPLKTSDYRANYGELVRVDPTGGEFTVYLPRVRKEDVGKAVAIVNVSGSINRVTIEAPDETALINGYKTWAIQNGYGVCIFLAASETSYVDLGDEYTRWEDLRFPSSALNPVGAVGEADRDSVNSFFLFDASSNETVRGICQIPHDWLPESSIEPHLHITSTTDPASSAGVNTVWLLSYKWYNVYGTIPSSFTNTNAVTKSLSVHVGGLPVHDYLEFGLIAGTGKGPSSIFQWILYRIGNTAADTYNHDASLIEFDIHYLRSRAGTIDEDSESVWT